MRESDKNYFENQFNRLLLYYSNISFSYSSDDLGDPKYLVGDKPADKNEIALLEKKLKGTYDDAVIYNNIGSIYKRLHLKNEAQAKFTKALERAHEMLLVEPDSANTYLTFASIHMNMENYIECAMNYEKAFELDSSNLTTRTMIPLAYMFAGDLERMLRGIQKNISIFPDDISSYYAYPLYFYYSLIVKMQLAEGDQRNVILKNKSIDEIMDISVLENGYKKNQQKKEFEILYNITRHMLTTGKIMITAMGDSTVMQKNYRFPMDEKDKAEFNRLEKYYKNCFKNDSITNQYYPHRALANIYLLQSKHKEAIPLLEKAIELKPASKCKIMSNTSDEYESLAYAYLMLGDTSAYKKTIRKKFKERPTIDPVAADYLSMATISFKEKKYDECEKYLNEAIFLGSNDITPFAMLAAIKIRQSKYEEALTLLDKGIKINRNEPAVYLLMGEVYLFQNEIPSAHYCIEKALKLSDTDSKLDRSLADKFFTVGN